jgi:hypothetical protein
MTTKTRAGFVIRSLSPVGTDVAPRRTIEKTAGVGLRVISGWRKGFRIFLGLDNAQEEKLDIDLYPGMTIPCTFNEFSLDSGTTDAALHGANNDLDDKPLVVAVIQDQRLLWSPDLGQGSQNIVQATRISPQSIAASGNYTIWDDAVNGTGHELTYQRFQSGVAIPRLLRFQFWWSCVTGGIGSSDLSVSLFAYTNPDLSIANEPLLIETWSSFAKLSLGISYVYGNTQRPAGSTFGQWGTLWPSTGGKLVIENSNVGTAANFYGALTFFGP